MYKNVVFFVCSNDIGWAKQNLVQSRQNIFFSNTSDAILDFATLSVMDHMIMSVGTFGWWASWIANGTTIYYKHPYSNGSSLEKKFNAEDFFPPQWIGLE